MAAGSAARPRTIRAGESAARTSPPGPATRRCLPAGGRRPLDGLQHRPVFPRQVGEKLAFEPGHRHLRYSLSSSFRRLPCIAAACPHQPHPDGAGYNAEHPGTRGDLARSKVLEDMPAGHQARGGFSGLCSPRLLVANQPQLRHADPLRRRYVAQRGTRGQSRRPTAWTARLGAPVCRAEVPPHAAG
jgi:hypothetical protein